MFIKNETILKYIYNNWYFKEIKGKKRIFENNDYKGNKEEIHFYVVQTNNSLFIQRRKYISLHVSNFL